MRSWRVFVLNTLNFWSRKKERRRMNVWTSNANTTVPFREKSLRKLILTHLSLLLRLLLTRTIEFRSYFCKIYSPMTFLNKSDYLPPTMYLGPTYVLPIEPFFSKFHIHHIFYTDVSAQKKNIKNDIIGPCELVRKRLE